MKFISIDEKSIKNSMCIEIYFWKLNLNVFCPSSVSSVFWEIIQNRQLRNVHNFITEINWCFNEFMEMINLIETEELADLMGIFYKRAQCIRSEKLLKSTILQYFSQKFLLLSKIKYSTTHFHLQSSKTFLFRCLCTAITSKASHKPKWIDYEIKSSKFSISFEFILQ